MEAKLFARPRLPLSASRFSIRLLALGLALAWSGIAQEAIRGNLSLPREWLVFGPVEQEAPVPDAAAFRAVPDSLRVGERTLAGRNAAVTDPFGRFDFAPLFGEGDGRGQHTHTTAYVFVPFAVPEAGPVTLGIGADWWVQAWLDGEEIFNTLPEGNGSWPPTALDHVRTFELAAGDHLLVVRFISGSGSSVLALGGPDVLRRGAPNIPFPNLLDQPMPDGNIVPGSDFENVPPGEPPLPAGWVMGEGAAAFRPGELRLESEDALSGTHSLMIDTLAGDGGTRRLSVPLAVAVDQLYEISYKAAHLGGGYASLSVRNEPQGGATSFLHAVGVPDLRGAVGPESRGSYSGCFFFDVPQPHLVIQAHGPVQVLLDDISIRPVSNSRQYDTWRDQRVPWEEAEGWHTLRDTVETPHTRWAKPLAGEPLRVLSLMPRWQHRRTVELAQRLSMDYEAILFRDHTSLGNAFWILDAVGDPELFQPLPQALAALARPLDCIYLAELAPGALPDAVVEAILERVRQGTGLVLTGCYYDRRVWTEAYTGGRWADALHEDNRTDVDVAFARLDPVAGRVPEPRFYRYGEGRIAVWSGFEGSRRAHFEAEMARTIKAMLWASGRVPSVQVGPLELPGRTTAPRRAEMSRADLPAPLRVEIAADRPIQIRAWLADTEGGEGETLGERNLARGESEAVFSVPLLPAGEHRLTVQVRDPATDPPGMVDWTTVTLAVTAAPSIEEIALADSPLPYYTQGDLLAGTVRLSQPPAAGQVLHLKLIDADGWLWHHAPLPVEGTEAKFEISLDHAFVLGQFLRAELLDGDGLVATAERTLTAVRQPAWYRNRFDYQLWQMPHRWHYLHRLANAAFRRQGIDTNYMGWPSEHFRDNNIRHVQTVGHWWIDMRREPGDYFPGIALQVVGDRERAPVREPCLTDPVFLASLQEHLDRTLDAKTVALAPVSYSIGHEENLRGKGNLGGELDVCFHPTSLASFREFLRAEHGNLAALNRAWGTAFADWEEVVPLVLGEAVENGQISRWIDHRRHMDRVWTGFLRTTMEMVRRHDPQAQGVTDNVRVSTTTLDSFSGVDFWLLLEGVAAGSGMPNPYLRSFVPEARRHLVASRTSTWNPGNITPDETLLELRIGNGAWVSLLSGLRGFSYWTHVWAGAPSGESNCYQPLAPDLRNLPMARWAGDPVAQIRTGIDRFVFAAERRHSGIAILHSRASEHAATAWHAVQGDGIAKRLHPPERIGYFTKTIESLGYSFEVLADAQIAEGALTAMDMRLLVLPFSQAVSRRAAAQIADFVAAGGTVLADIRPAVADEHGTVSDLGLLDGVFGIRQHPAWRAFSPTVESVRVAGRLGGGDELDLHLSGAFAGPSLEAEGAVAIGQAGEVPAILVNRPGDGLAILLNAAPRMGDPAARDLLGEILSAAGLAPLFAVSSLAADDAATLGTAVPVPAEAEGAPADAEGFTNRLKIIWTEESAGAILPT